MSHLLRGVNLESHNNYIFYPNCDDRVLPAPSYAKVSKYSEQKNHRFYFPHYHKSYSISTQ